MATITKTPTSYSIDPGNVIEAPNTIDECLEFGITPSMSEVYSVQGTVAVVDIDFAASLTVPADGTGMLIWGHRFEVNNAAGAETSNTFRFVSDPDQTHQFFMAMLNANAFFIKNVVIYRTGVNPYRVNIDWVGCGERPNFNSANMDFSEFAGTGVTGSYANGTNGTPVDGFIMQTRLLMYSGGSFLPVTAFEAIRPTTSCSFAYQSTIDYGRDIRRLLRTPLPAMLSTNEIASTDQGIINRFKIEYGTTYRDGNCQPQSGTFKKSGEILVLNAAFPLEEPYGIRWFYENADGGLPSEANGVQWFLTNQPKAMDVCPTSFLWLWFLNGDYTSMSPFPKYGLRFYVKKTDGTDSTHDVFYNRCLWFQCNNFNVSVARAASLAGVPATSIEYYEVTVHLANSSNIISGSLSETLRFVISTQCANCTDAYFLTPPGGFGTLVCDVIEKEVTQTGTEICLDTLCASTRSDIARNGGRYYANVRSYDQVTIRARSSFTDEHVNYFRAFKASPERYLRVSSGSGYIAKRFNVEFGSVRIFKDGEFVELVASGYLSDIPIQTSQHA